VHCALCTVYSLRARTQHIRMGAHRTVQSARCAVYSIQYTLYSIHFTAYSLQSTPSSPAAAGGQLRPSGPEQAKDDSPCLCQCLCASASEFIWRPSGQIPVRLRLEVANTPASQPASRQASCSNQSAGSGGPPLCAIKLIRSHRRATLARGSRSASDWGRLSVSERLRGPIFAKIGCRWLAGRAGLHLGALLRLESGTGWPRESESELVVASRAGWRCVGRAAAAHSLRRLARASAPHTVSRAEQVQCECRKSSACAVQKVRRSSTLGRLTGSEGSVASGGSDRYLCARARARRQSGLSRARGRQRARRWWRKERGGRRKEREKGRKRGGPAKAKERRPRAAPKGPSGPKWTELSGHLQPDWAKLGPSSSKKPQTVPLERAGPSSGALGWPAEVAGRRHAGRDSGARGPPGAQGRARELPEEAKKEEAKNFWRQFGARGPQVRGG